MKEMLEAEKASFKENKISEEVVNTVVKEGSISWDRVDEESKKALKALLSPEEELKLISVEDLNAALRVIHNLRLIDGHSSMFTALGLEKVLIERVKADKKISLERFLKSRKS